MYITDIKINELAIKLLFTFVPFHIIVYYRFVIQVIE